MVPVTVSKRIVYYSIVVIFLLGSQSESFAAVESDSWAKMRPLFKLGMAAVDRGDDKSYRRHLAKLKTYPLYRYLRFSFLKKTIQKGTKKQINSYINRYRTHMLSERLRTHWLLELARRKHWKNFVHAYKKQNGTALQCHYAYALFKTGRKQKAAKIAKKLWLVSKIQPKECLKTFKQYQNSGLLDQTTVWQRAVLAMQGNHIKLARFLVKQLEKEQDRVWLKHWLKTHQQPESMLQKDVLQQDIDIVRQIVRHGIKRIAKTNLEKAWLMWQDIKQKYRHTEDDIAEMDQYLAAKAGYQGHPKALQWFQAIKKVTKTSTEWRIRLALREVQWQNVLSGISILPAEIQDKENWRYWYARSLQEIGKRDANQMQIKEALAVFNELAKTRSYYGFLAADRIGSQYDLQIRAANFNNSQIYRLAKKSAIVRARELFLLEMFPDARREWQSASKNLKREELKYLAALANRWGWHDRAILTYIQFEAARHSKVDLPYPMAYLDAVQSNAKRQKIDSAWIYGIIRQESAFMFDARSSAGALGLMQMMPGTARVVSRLTKLPRVQTSDLLNPEINIQFGSAYLRMLLDKHNGNEVLTTSSYNAGRGRTLAWLPSKTIPADVWVESIPFNETRNYVGSVLTYTVIFDYLLSGNTSRLYHRMPNIDPLAKK